MIDMKNVNKIILIDWGYFLHSSVFAWGAGERQIPATYTCMTMIIASLKRVGLDPDDLIIVAVDGRGNWRRDYDPNYKANRQDKKDKGDIDWAEQYVLFDKLADRLKDTMPFHFIKIPKLEADDIIATVCQTIKDKPIRIISVDSDFDQLYAYPNVRMYSPKAKRYKIIDNPYAILASKIKKEATDNLVTEIKTDEDYERRKMLVNLITLPKFVTDLVLDKLNEIEYTDYDLENMPFKKGLKKRFEDTYNSNCIVNIDVELKPKRKKKKCIHSKEKASKVICSNLLTSKASPLGSF
jgi:hypothetical protein